MDANKPLPAAPPTYSETVGNNNNNNSNVVHPEDVVVINPIEPAVTIIYIDEKIAPTFEPYHEICPHCRVSVLTRVKYTMGFCSWVMVFLGVFLFFPLLLCYWCACFKDVEHYCPQCNRLIAYKSR